MEYNCIVIVTNPLDGQIWIANATETIWIANKTETIPTGKF